jgi:hypothetical protein
MENGKKFEALQVLASIAIVNDKTEAFLDSGMEQQQLLASQINYEKNAEPRVKYSFLDLLRDKEMRKNLLICCLLLITNQIVYFGTAFAIDDIGVDIYINALILGLAELLGLLSSG